MSRLTVEDPVPVYIAAARIPRQGYIQGHGTICRHKGKKYHETKLQPPKTSPRFSLLIHSSKQNLATCLSQSPMLSNHQARGMPLITCLPSIVFSICYAIAVLTFLAIVAYYTHRGYSCRHTDPVLCSNDSLHCHAGAGNNGGMQVLQKLQGWVLRIKSGWFQAISLRLGEQREVFGYVRTGDNRGQFS